MSGDERIDRLRLPGRHNLSRSLDSIFDSFLTYDRDPDTLESEATRKRQRSANSSDDSPPITESRRRLAESKRRRIRTFDDTAHGTDSVGVNVDSERGRELNPADFSLLDDILVNNMARTHMTLKEARSLIPHFDGTRPEEVDDIINAYSYAHDSIAPTEQPELLRAVMKTKVTGKAAKNLKYKTIDSFEKFRDELFAQYGSRRTVAALQIEFNTCRQNVQETVLAFGQRLEKIMMELIDVSTVNIGIPSQREGIEGYIRQMGLYNFERGLKREYQLLVKARGYPDLTTAVKGAMEEERTTQGNESITRQTHVERRSFGAYQRNARPGDDTRGYQTYRPTQGRYSLPAPQKSVFPINITCNYCGKRGHMYRECRIRLGGQGSSNGYQPRQDSRGQSSRGRPNSRPPGSNVSRIPYTH